MLGCWPEAPFRPTGKAGSGYRYGAFDPPARRRPLRGAFKRHAAWAPEAAFGGRVSLGSLGPVWCLAPVVSADGGC